MQVDEEGQTLPVGGAEVPATDAARGSGTSDGMQPQDNAGLSCRSARAHGGKAFWRDRAPLLAVVALLVAGMMVGGTVVWGYLSARDVVSPPVSGPVNAVPVVDEATAGTVTAVYNQVAAAVVRVETSRVTPGLFGPQSEEGTGSGVIVDGKGYVLTNYHVVPGAGKVSVTLADGATVQGEVAGTDPGNDLAVVKADLTGHKVKVALLGDSDRVQVGELAIAIGNPFGLDRTVTVGIIGGKDRQMTGITGRTITGLLQTDAALNPGNSGGPLLNARGEVIGINTAIESPVRGSVGIGFAIPVNTARRVLPALLSGQRVEHPWLGIAGTAVTPELADRLGLRFEPGVLVTEVVEGGPAQRAGLRPLSTNQSGRAVAGDIITAVDERAVKSVDDIVRYLETKRPGDEVTLTVLRDGSRLQLKVVLAAWPENLTGQ